MSGGFDVVCGNPPWEKIKLQEKEFFAGRDEEITKSRTASIRNNLIRRLPQNNPALFAEYTAALYESEVTSHFLRNSNRFPLTARGDINTYAVFSGLARHSIASSGRTGLVVPSGIATDFTYRDFLAEVISNRQLAFFYDFENRNKLFPDVDSRMKFCLLTLAGSGMTEAYFAFFLHSVDDLIDPERCFSLNDADLALMNPNTRTLPVFHSRRDAKITRKLYQAKPVLVNEESKENPWNVSLTTMYHSGGASGLFYSYDELTEMGFRLEVGNRFERDNKSYLPLYEGKMFLQYDHRAAQIAIEDKNIKRAAISDGSSVEQKREPTYYPMPRFWVESIDVQSNIPNTSNYWVVFKKVTSPTNERTLLAAILPIVAANDSIHFVVFSSDTTHQHRLAFYCNLNTLVLDFVSRQKLGGLNFNFWVFQQLPIIPPNHYTTKLLDFIVPRIVELTYTAWDLHPFAQDILNDVGQKMWKRWFKDTPVNTNLPPSWTHSDTPPPFIWNEERRARLRVELDALYAHLYGLTKEELSYILDTFPIVRRKDEAKYGEYRTKRLILENYDKLPNELEGLNEHL